jgi:hypothetical protein
LEPFEDGQLFGRDEQFDASWDAGLPTDETRALEGDDHLVHRGRADAKVSLHVGFGGRTSDIRE